VAALLLAGMAAAQAPAADEIRAGMTARRAGDFAAAETAFQRALALQPGDAETLTMLALVQGYQNKYEQALTTITAAEAVAPQDMDITLAKARILAWMSRYQEAGVAIDRVITARPTDAEAWALKGRIAYYQDRPSAARAAFTEALKHDPRHLDATLGLGDVARAGGDEQTAQRQFLRAQALDPASRDVQDRLNARADDTTPKWLLSTSLGYSWLSRTPLGDWTEQSVRLERLVGGSLRVFAGGTHARRFGLNDVDLYAGASGTLARGITGELTVGTTPDDDFLPAWRTLGSLGARITDDTTLLLDGSLRHYRTGTIKGFNLGIEQYLLAGRVGITGKFINTIDAGGRHLTGWSAAVLVSPLDRLRLRVGYADAPESEAGIVADSTSWSGGIAMDLTSALTLRIDFTREKRQRAYVREELTGGIAVRF
jgi:YaiO family outer membrane protein